MNSAFYTAGLGAAMQQNKMNVISNNMANINTTGFKSKNPVFSELVYSNYTTTENQLQSGHGMRLDKTSENSSQNGALVPTDGKLDFAINGDGYFAVQKLDGEDVLYSRDGRFQISIFDDTAYLTNSSGLLVLNEDQEPIEMEGLTTNATLEQMGVGVFYIPIKDGMISEGYGTYSLTDKNGEAEVMENPKLIRGSLESSNADLATEMTRIMEAQRAYSLSLKMVQTSDEVEQEINSLRR